MKKEQSSIPIVAKWFALTVVLLLAGLMVPACPMIQKQSVAADRTKALGKVRQIGLSLFEFDAEFGSFPSEATAAIVKERNKSPLSLGAATSNQAFRQLIAYGLKSEQPFYAKIAGSRKPDDRFQDDAHALQAGECGFAYIAGLSSRVDPGTPIIVSPLIPGTTRFDPAPFGSRALVLKADNSATAIPIDSSGRGLINGKDIFDPSQPYWKGKAPDIKWQE